MQPHYQQQQQQRRGGASLNDPAVQGALLRLGPVNIAGTLTSVAQAAVARHPIKLSLNFLGLALLLLLPGLAPSDEQSRRYSALQPSLPALEAEASARRARDSAHHAYRASVGFLWSCDATCTHRQRAYEAALAAWQAAHGRVEAQLIAANSELGIFSAPAVEQARDLFWGAFGQGMAMVRGGGSLLPPGARARARRALARAALNSLAPPRAPPPPHTARPSA